MKKILFLVGFVLIAMQGLFAQQIITGKVISEESGEPVIGGTVRAYTDSPELYGTSTNIDGEYRIKTPERIKKLVFDCVGCTTLEVLIDKNEEEQILNVTLQPSSILLPEEN